MHGRVFIFLLLLLYVTELYAKNFIVADSIARMPLPTALIFNIDGKFLGTSNSNGVVTFAKQSDYPLTVRYLGFNEKQILINDTDTVFLEELITELPEVEVVSKRNSLLHILAYMREYSTLSSYTDTVRMFREKMVDFMLPADKEITKYIWRYPRILNARSYYRFTNANGLDSVSDKCQHHFTWSDWVGILPPVNIPAKLSATGISTDTVLGKYSPKEIWVRNDDRLTINVNVLADSSCHRWVPALSSFLKNTNIDFDQFYLHLNYDNITNGGICPLNLVNYSFNIESSGRGRDMFQFNQYDQPFFVTTYTEVYIIDKEYISMKEAKKWDQRKFDTSVLEIYEPEQAPELHPSTLALIDRVNGFDGDKVRLSMTSDYRLVSRNVLKKNFQIGYRALALLKQVTGITYIRSHRNFNKNWNNFRMDQIIRNNQRDSILLNDRDRKKKYDP